MKNKFLKGCLTILMLILLPFVVVFFGVETALDMFDSNKQVNDDK